MFSKISENLRRSKLYVKNNISYETMNQIYRSSKSIPNFAKNVMRQLFSVTELKRCTTVFGRTFSSKTSTRYGLNAARVELIRQMVEENYYNDPKLWPYCVSVMNGEIKLAKRR